MVRRAYKYRIYQTKKQTEYLKQTFCCVRFVWDQLVDNFNFWSSEGPNRPMNEKILDGTPEYGWLPESISYALQQKRMDFDETKKQYFSKKRKAKLGRMKFKKKGGSHGSFRIPVAPMGGQKAIDLDNNRIKLPKMGTMKLIVDREFAGIAKLKNWGIEKIIGQESVQIYACGDTSDGDYEKSESSYVSLNQENIPSLEGNHSVL